jgi:hypothetical protein
VCVTLAESSSAASLRHVLRFDYQPMCPRFSAELKFDNGNDPRKEPRWANKGDVREIYDHVVIWALKKSAALQNSCLPAIFCWAVLQVRPRLD